MTITVRDAENAFHYFWVLEIDRRSLSIDGRPSDVDVALDHYRMVAEKGTHQKEDWPGQTTEIVERLLDLKAMGVSKVDVKFTNEGIAGDTLYESVIAKEKEARLHYGVLFALEDCGVDSFEKIEGAPANNSNSAGREANSHIAKIDDVPAPVPMPEQENQSIFIQMELKIRALRELYDATDNYLKVIREVVPTAKQEYQLVSVSDDHRDAARRVLQTNIEEKTGRSSYRMLEDDYAQNIEVGMKEAFVELLNKDVPYSAEVLKNISQTIAASLLQKTDVRNPPVNPIPSLGEQYDPMVEMAQTVFSNKFCEASAKSEATIAQQAAQPYNAALRDNLNQSVYVLGYIKHNLRPESYLTARMAYELVSGVKQGYEATLVQQKAPSRPSVQEQAQASPDEALPA